MTKLNLSRRRMLTLGASILASAGLAACTIGTADEDITGIIGAMESEVDALKNAMGGMKVTTISGMDYCEGSISGKNVVVVQCGIGKVNAGICAQVLCTTFKVDRIINTGVAGSLTDDLSINDFVISTEAVQHDFDCSPTGFGLGEIPYTGLVAFPADEGMRALALEAVKEASPESKVLEGRVCSGDQFIATDEQVETITENFGGMCCEMEGGAIAQVCYLNETPYVIIRAISDDSDGTEYAEFEASVAKECADAVLAMIDKL